MTLSTPEAPPSWASMALNSTNPGINGKIPLTMGTERIRWRYPSSRPTFYITFSRGFQSRWNNLAFIGTLVFCLWARFRLRDGCCLILVSHSHQLSLSPSWCYWQLKRTLSEHAKLHLNSQVLINGVPRFHDFMIFGIYDIVLFTRCVEPVDYRIRSLDTCCELRTRSTILMTR